MTTDTTGAKSAVKKSRPWLTIILGVSLLLHVVAWFALKPLGKTVMAFDQAEEAQRTEEVQKRELERQERERERRQERPLNREQSERLKREAERKQKREIAERLQELAKVREDLEEVRQQTFEQLHERTKEDVAMLTQAELARELNELKRMVLSITEHEDKGTGENEQLREAVKTLDQQYEAVDEANAVDPQSNQALDQTVDALIDQLEQARTRNDVDIHGDRRTRAGLAGQQARKVAELTERLANADVQQMNDTSTATAATPPPAPSDEALAQAEPAELYDQAVAMEEQITAANNDIRAAELAMSQNTGFQDAQAMLHTQAPQRPDLAPALGAQPQTVGELNTLRETLDQAAGQAQDMAMNGQAILAQAQGLAQRNGAAGNRFARQAMMSMAVANSGRGVVDLTAMMSQGGGEGESDGMNRDATGEGANMAAGRSQPSIQLSQDQVLAKAMPGRMFTESSERSGWLYIDTWYVIGPWENHSNVDFETTHPPEYEVDFDAVYHDGKFADRPNSDYRELKWEFVQSDHIRVEPPKVFAASTYYAYTEVYFDHDRDMLIAIASDDAAQMWVNDEVVWADYGQSPWRLGEGYRRVRFKKGFNTILARIENGPAHCIWSVLLCPPEAVSQ